MYGTGYGLVCTYLALDCYEALSVSVGVGALEGSYTRHASRTMKLM
jgi:hypothetical protein